MERLLISIDDKKPLDSRKRMTITFCRTRSSTRYWWFRLGFMWQSRTSWAMVGYVVGLLVGSPLLDEVTGWNIPSLLAQAWVYSSIIAFLSMPEEIFLVSDDITTFWSFAISLEVAFLGGTTAFSTLLAKGRSSYDFLGSILSWICRYVDNSGLPKQSGWAIINQWCVRIVKWRSERMHQTGRYFMEQTVHISAPPVLQWMSR